MSKQTDMAVRWSAAAQMMDLSVYAGDLDTASPLEMAVFVSLGTDARAEDADNLPTGEDPRGWFGDSFAADPSDRIGCLWWTKRREVLTDDLADWYGKEGTRALAWLVEDKLARSAEVTGYRSRSDRTSMVVVARVVRPDFSVMTLDVSKMWEDIRNG